MNLYLSYLRFIASQWVNNSRKQQQSGEAEAVPDCMSPYC